MDNLGPPGDFIWFPGVPRSIQANVNDPLYLVWFGDATQWDVWRIDQITLVLSYDITSDNCSAEVGISDTGGISFAPIMAVAAAATLSISITEYINKVADKTETPFYMDQFSTLAVRGESNGTSSSTFTAAVFWSGARWPDA